MITSLIILFLEAVLYTLCIFSISNSTDMLKKAERNNWPDIYEMACKEINNITNFRQLSLLVTIVLIVVVFMMRI